MMRPLIQYDFDPPPTAPSPTTVRPKKRRRWTPKSRTQRRHWDDPGSSAFGMVYDEQEEGRVTDSGARMDGVVEEGECSEAEEGEEGEEEEEEEEESRPLTYGEIWDDAALIDAWNSAEAEYEAYHGTSKAWKTEPVKRSPLWYNKPYVGPITPQPSSHNTPGPSQSYDDNGGDQPEPEPEPDTAPLDFHTYVPTHDPSLAIPSNASASTTPAPFFIPPPSTTTVSRDEAFNNALCAMYWSGYWTAVYHSQNQTSKENDNETTEVDGIEADDGQDLVSTQR